MRWIRLLLLVLLLLLLLLLLRVVVVIVVVVVVVRVHVVCCGPPFVVAVVVVVVVVVVVAVAVAWCCVDFAFAFAVVLFTCQYSSSTMGDCFTLLHSEQENQRCCWSPTRTRTRFGLVCVEEPGTQDSGLRNYRSFLEDKIQCSTKTHKFLPFYSPPVSQTHHHNSHFIATTPVVAPHTSQRHELQESQMPFVFAQVQK